MGWTAEAKLITQRSLIQLKELIEEPAEVNHSRHFLFKEFNEFKWNQLINYFGIIF